MLCLELCCLLAETQMQRWNDFWVLEFAADAEDAHTSRPLSLAKVICVISIGHALSILSLCSLQSQGWLHGSCTA